MALGYSVTFGLLVNRAILNKENHNTNLQTSLILCFLSFYWLPLFAGKLSKTVDVQKNSPRKLGATAYETSDISDDEYEAIVRNVKGVGQVKIKALINEFPSVHSFLNASDDEISRKTQRLIGRSLSNNIREEILNRVEI